MSTLAAIRTHRWGEDEERLCAQLVPIFGDRLVVVFHDRPASVVPPLPVIDITSDWVVAQGLRNLPDWGWRCGDYFLYALRQARPDHDRYWLIEPDVWFSGPVAELFDIANGFDHDLLGVRVGPMPSEHRFSRGLPDMDHYRAIFALTRFSGRAIDRLLTLRQAYSATGAGKRFFTNDEIFSFTHVVADPDLSVGDLAELVPAWFADDQVQTDPDILLDTLADRTGPGVFHPVRGRASFMGALAGRLAGNTGFLAALAVSLADLSPDEIAAIGAETARQSVAAIDEVALAHRQGRKVKGVQG